MKPYNGSQFPVGWSLNYGMTEYILLDPLFNTKLQLTSLQLHFGTSIFLHMLFPLTWMCNYILHLPFILPHAVLQDPAVGSLSSIHPSSVPGLTSFIIVLPALYYSYVGSSPSLSPVLSEERQWFLFSPLFQCQRWFLIDVCWMTVWMGVIMERSVLSLLISETILMHPRHFTFGRQ